jgi:hypothetical protein
MSSVARLTWCSLRRECSVAWNYQLTGLAALAILF